MIKGLFRGENKKWARGILWMLSRPVTIYVLTVLVLCVLFDCKLIIHRARLKVLNRLAPSEYYYLIDPVEKGEKFDPKILEEYRYFYEKVVSCLEPGADAFGMLAFCTYYLGDENRAMALYEEAAALMSKFFIFHYNLGVLFFQKGDDEKTKFHLRKAIETKLEENLNLITSSRLYFPFFQDIDHVQDELQERERSNYLQAYQMLVQSCYRMKDYGCVIQAANEALVISLPEPEYFEYYLGLVAYDVGKYDFALNYFRAVLERNPEDPDALNFFGLSVGALGDGAMAQRAVAQANYLKSLGRGGVGRAKDFRVRLF